VELRGRKFLEGGVGVFQEKGRGPLGTGSRKENSLGVKEGDLKKGGGLRGEDVSRNERTRGKLAAKRAPGGFCKVLFPKGGSWGLGACGQKFSPGESQ